MQKPENLNDLTFEERRWLGHFARSESMMQEDFRYWDKDPVKREFLKKRWLDIANMLLLSTSEQDSTV